MTSVMGKLLTFTKLRILLRLSHGYFWRKI